MELQLIRQKIYDIRGQRVMLDFDLAELYEVETRALNQAVKRNRTRFPEDFMFQLDPGDWRAIRLAILNTNSSHFVTSYRKQRGASYIPFAFTEQGIAMLSPVLRSEKAIQVNIAIMRAFAKFRRYALTYAEMAHKIAESEAKFEKEFANIHEVLKWLAAENQTRADDITAMQTEQPQTSNWENRLRIGFK